MKKFFSFVLALIIAFSAVLLVNAASTSDLTFTLNSDGKSYIVSKCSTSASGSLTIPSTYNGKPVTIIGLEAFENCNKLTSITIPNSITNIYGYAFENCTNLTSVTFGNSVKSIGNYSFCKCKSLTSITIPDGVTSIETHAFYYCENLASITIPDSVTSIGSSAFENTPVYDINDWENGVLYLGNHLIQAARNISGSYTIKAGTKCIADDAFLDDVSHQLSELTSITIPNSVTNIGKNAFRYCGKLKSIKISDSVTSIGLNAFYGTAYYKNASNWKNGVLYIGNHLIEAEDTIKGAYTVESGTKTIADYAFYECSKLTSVIIENGVAYIGEGAFEDCTGITAVTLPDSLKNIDDYAFKGCTSLTSITLPDSVTHIGVQAFRYCKSLKCIVIPNSVKSIGENAFYNSNSVTVYCNKNSTAESYAKANNLKYEYIVKLATPTVTASNTSKGVSVKWSKVSGADGYYVYRKKSTDKSFTKIATVEGGSTLSYTDTKASGNTKYVYTVKAYKGSTSGAYNKTGKTILFLCAPATKSANKNGYINVSWNKISGAKGYVIYKKTGSGSYKKLATIKSGSTVSYKDKSVKSGTKYTYYVKAYNGSTYSGYKASSALMYLAPVKISSAASGKSGITVKWGKISASKGYTVYRKTGSGSYSKLATVKGTTKVSYLDKSAKKGKTYTYYVTAYNGSCKGAYANTKACKDKY